MEDSRVVVINDATYSLVSPPGSDKQLVLAERNKLLGHIDLRSLVHDLGRVGGCIRVAYNGVTAAGPNLTELQIEVQRLGYDIRKLCDKSAVTVSKFKRTSATILSDLQTAYQYLLDGYEDMGLRTLAGTSDLAGAMAPAAEELRKSFDDEAKTVEKVLEKTEIAKGKQGHRVQEMKRKKEELEHRRKEQEEILQKAKDKEKEADKRVRELEAQEQTAITEFEESTWVKIVNSLTHAVVGIRPFGKPKETNEQQLKAIRENKAEALEFSREREHKRLEALAKLTEFAVGIGNCRSEEDFAKAVTESLHSTMEGLRILSTLMMHTALYWKQMQEHCNTLGEDKMKDDVKYAMANYDREKLSKYWTSNGFKKQAVRFYARWVAVDNVCGDYMEAINQGNSGRALQIYPGEPNV